MTTADKKLLMKLSLKREVVRTGLRAGTGIKGSADAGRSYESGSGAVSDGGGPLKETLPPEGTTP